MEIDYPTGVQEPQLRTLWQLSFGDSEEFIAGFFAGGYCPRRCRCAAENGNVAAALYWFDADRNSPISTPWRPTRISGTGGFAAP